MVMMVINKIIDVWWWLYRLWKYKICYLHKEARWFFQRGLRGYSDYDTRNFDSYLAGIISGGLKHLSENSHGWAFGHEFKTPDDWKKFLQKMSAEFKKYNLKFDEEFNEELGDEEFYRWYKEKFAKETLPRFIEYFECYWD